MSKMVKIEGSIKKPKVAADPKKEKKSKKRSFKKKSMKLKKLTMLKKCLKSQPEKSEAGNWLNW